MSGERRHALSARFFSLDENDRLDEWTNAQSLLDSKINPVEALDRLARDEVTAWEKKTISQAAEPSGTLILENPGQESG